MAILTVKEIAERNQNDVKLFKTLTPVELLDLYVKRKENNDSMLFELSEKEEQFLLSYAKPLYVSIKELDVVLTAALNTSMDLVKKYVKDHNVSVEITASLFEKLRRKS